MRIYELDARTLVEALKLLHESEVESLESASDYPHYTPSDDCSDAVDDASGDEAHDDETDDDETHDEDNHEDDDDDEDNQDEDYHDDDSHDEDSHDDDESTDNTLIHHGTGKDARKPAVAQYLNNRIHPQPAAYPADSVYNKPGSHTTGIISHVAALEEDSVANLSQSNPSERVRTWRMENYRVRHGAKAAELISTRAKPEDRKTKKRPAPSSSGSSEGECIFPNGDRLIHGTRIDMRSGSAVPEIRNCTTRLWVDTYCNRKRDRSPSTTSSSSSFPNEAAYKRRREERRRADRAHGTK